MNESALATLTWLHKLRRNINMKRQLNIIVIGFLLGLSAHAAAALLVAAA